MKKVTTKPASHDDANAEDLPEGWCSTKVGALTDVVRGASPRPKGDPRYFGGSIPWIMISDITRQYGKFLYTTKDHITEAGANLSRRLPTGSLILSNSGSVCIPKLLGVEGCIHDGFLAFPDLHRFVSLNYAYWWFEYLRPAVIDEHRQGITQVNLNTGIARNLRFALSPRAEQDRISEKIEELLEKVNASRDRLAKVPKILKAFRQSVLAAACSGRLTEDWREHNPQEAVNLPSETEKGTLPAIAEDELFFEAPLTWRWTRLGSVADFINGDRGKNYPNKKEYVAKGIPFINTGHIQPDGSLSSETMHYLTRAKFDSLNSGKIRKGDLVYCLRGATLAVRGKSQKTVFIENVSS